MIKKEKIFELKIQEDDDISGIDSISLVDEPAIEVNWVAFKKEVQEDFHIPDNEDEKYLELLLSKGQSEQELFDNGWEIDSINFQDFGTTPNEPSFEDTPERLVRYKYILNPKISESPIIATTRTFCKDLLNKNNVWRVEDMEQTMNDFGQSALVWRGGFNCRHKWAQIKYKRGTTIINKASIKKGVVDDQLNTTVIGYDQPDTVTNKTKKNPKPSTVKNLGLSKENMDTCPKATQDIATNLKNRQNAIDTAHYGPLNPNEPNEDYWKAKAKMFNGDVESAKKSRCGNCAFFVQTKSMLDCIANGINDKNEWDTIDAGDLGYCEAFDFKCASSRTCDAWVVGGPITDENMGYDVGTIGGYVDPGLKKKPIPKAIATSKEFLEQFDKLNFESHNDYPQEVKDVAKRVLDWVEKNGWGSCGTDVGKQRANQLAKGEPLSESTIHRMYSYLSRHKVDLQSSKSYEDGCGKLMYDSWGGAPALQWSERKIQILNKHRMDKQHFQTDEEKHIVLGPAMIPNQHIFRKDAQGNPYYVFFSPETIKMIADKYFKNKFIDNNDENHDGSALPDVYVTESWIKESNNDKSTDYGFGELPVGTWFVAMKVNNPEVWSKVKDGQLNGFSVSGFFEEVSKFTKEEMFLYKVAEVLKNIKE